MCTEGLGWAQILRQRDGDCLTRQVCMRFYLVCSSLSVRHLLSGVGNEAIQLGVGHWRWRGRWL